MCSQNNFDDICPEGNHMLNEERECSCGICVECVEEMEKWGINIFDKEDE